MTSAAGRDEAGGANAPEALRESREGGRDRTGGVVYIVGAGPGRADLITVRGLRLVRSCDVLVYDRLIDPALVEEAPSAAERIFVGKEPGRHPVRQAEINALLVDRARHGRVVVRLKGGDPFVFGRGGEEAHALRNAGVRHEIVPGVTSAVGVPAAAGIPVTHRRLASAFAVVTGHECAGATDLDWAALARIPTLVVLMGHRTLAAIAARLIAHGAPPDTPAAVISRGATPEQRTVLERLDRIAGAAADAVLAPPSILVVGKVVRLANMREVIAGVITDARR